MGVLDRLKNNETEEEIKEKILNQYNIFEGIECEVIFPDIQLKIRTHSGFAKGVATLGFGLVGLAATNSIKHEEQNRIINTEVQIAEKGIVFKQATSESKDLRIPYENVIFSEEHRFFGQFIIKLLENQDIIITPLAKKPNYAPKYIREHMINVINERACGAQYEEAGWGLEHAPEQSPESPQENSSLMDELERLGNMYKEGLLTDEEFATMKKKLINK